MEHGFDWGCILSLELLVAIPIAAPLLLAKFVLLGPDEDLWLLAVGTGCAMVALIVLMFRNRHLNPLQLKSGKS